MDDRRDTDDALLTAAEHARQAEQQLIETPVENPAIVPKARTLQHRAEDIGELAMDAAEQT